MENYAEEVKAKWGNTKAYSESQEKLKGKTDLQKKNMADGLMKQFAEIGKLKQLSPDSGEAQASVKALQKYISDNFYTCTNEILSGLGQMYFADERFCSAIDNAGCGIYQSRHRNIL